MQAPVLEMADKTKQQINGVTQQGDHSVNLKNKTEENTNHIKQDSEAKIIHIDLKHD